MSTLIVAAVLVAPFTLYSSGQDSSEYVGEKQVVRYHYGAGEDDYISVTYFGTAVAEYSPENWSGHFVGKNADGGEIQKDNEYGSNTTINSHKVTINVSWEKHLNPLNRDGSVELPWTPKNIVSDGDVTYDAVYNVIRVYTYGIGQSNQQITIEFDYALSVDYVFGGWVTSDSDESPIDPGEILDDGVTDLYAKWVLPDVFLHNIYIDKNEDYVYSVRYSDYITSVMPYGGDYSKAENADSSKYTTIYDISGKTVDTQHLSTGTYRSDGSGIIDCSGDPHLSGEVIIDNVKLKGDGGYHERFGYITTQTNTGLYASGYRLIIGPNVDCSYPDPGYVQIYGGSKSGNQESSITDVRIFDGVFSNVIGGSGDGTHSITETNVLVAGDAEVLESIIGGSIQGEVETTHVYVVGGKVNANKLSEDAAGNQKLPPGFSTVIGGSRYGDVQNDQGTGSTNVIISGDSEVYAVQGGGRHASSHADVTNVTISGKAVVEYMVCGSVTDGRPSTSSDGYYDYSKVPVDRANISVLDSAEVADVYGGGWDIWEDPREISTKTTSISVSGNPKISSIYGGGFRGPIGAGTDDAVRITISGGDIGSVYGGGRGGEDLVVDHDGSRGGGYYNSTGLAYVYGGVSIDIVGGSVDHVYGGGYGVDKKDYDTIGVDDSAKVVGNSISVIIGKDAVIGETNTDDSVFGGGNNADVLCSEVSVELRDGSEVRGNVYGGGNLGIVSSQDESQPPSISISIGESTVGANVYAGGLGVQNSLSVYSGTRTIIINGAEILGSIYGGSRDGDDNGSMGSDGFAKEPVQASVHIYILSGNLSVGSSGNIYGGSYRGHSYMDTNIYVGVPALDMVQEEPKSGVLTIDSIFGGASTGQSSNLDEAVLTYGSTSITIGSHDGDTPRYDQFCISGDVFGEGDFCSIDPNETSTVVFDNMGQEDGLLSIQKVDTLSIVGSDIHLLGNVDSSGGSSVQRVSLNRIGMVVMESESGIKSSLKLDAAASGISGYQSLYDGDVVPPEDVGQYNELRMNHGMILSILGEGNDGSGVGRGSIRGHTLFLSDSNPYYGAFAMGALTGVEESSLAFYVKSGNGYVEVQHIDYEYDGGRQVRAWFIQGAYKVEGTAVLDDGLDDGSGLSKDVSMMIPKIIRGSTVSIVGAYVNSDTKDSLVLTDEVDAKHPGTHVQMLVGVGDSEQRSQTLFNGGTGFPLSESLDEIVDATSSGLYMTIRVSTAAGFLTSGFIGSVTIHFVEMNGGVVANVFDVQISVYLRISEQQETISREIIMRKDEGGGYYGDSEVYLPILANNAIAEYRVESVTLAVKDGGRLGITTEKTNLNRDGWHEAYYRNSALEYPTGNGQSIPAFLGTGGGYSPVLGLHYTSGETFGTVTIVISVTPEGGTAPTRTLTIEITPTYVPKITVSFVDKYLGNDSSDPWVEKPLFSIDMDFQTTVSQYWIAVNADIQKTSKGDDPVDGNAVSKYLETMTGYILTITDVDGTSIVLTGSETDIEGYLSDEGLTGQYIPMPIYSFPEDEAEGFLNILVDRKPVQNYSINGTTGVFDYAKEDPGWYDSKLGHADFDFGSLMTNDLTVYAGYSVIITFKAIDKDSKEEVPIRPDSSLPGAPGAVLDLDKIAAGLEPSAGYSLVDNGTGEEPSYVWYDNDSFSTPIAAPSEYRVYSTMTLYVMVERDQYVLGDVILKDESGVVIAVSFTYTVNGESANEPVRYYFGDKMGISFSLPEGYSGYHIMDVSGTLSNGTQWNSFTHEQDGASCTVSVGSAPASELSVTVVVSDRFDITVSLGNDPLGNYSENEHFDLLLSGTTVVPVSAGSGDHSVELRLSPGQSFTIDTTGTSWDGVGVTAHIYLTDGTEVGAVNGRVDVGDITGNVTYHVYLRAEWTLTQVNGVGYGAVHSSVNPITKQYTVSDSLPGTVHTGDRLDLTPYEEYQLDDSFVYSGVKVSIQGPNMVCVVDGSGHVVLGDAKKLEIHVTVLVLFETSMPADHGSVTVTDSDGRSVVLTEPLIGDDDLRYVTALDEGSFTFALDVPGYQSYSTGNLAVYNGMVVTMYAVVHLEGSGTGDEDGSLTIVVNESVVGTYSVDPDVGLEFSFTVDIASFKITVREGTATIESQSGSPIRLTGVFTTHINGFGTLTLMAVPDADGSGGA